MNHKISKTEKTVIGSGCFWCSEAIFKSVEGIVSVVPGYAGGSTVNPTYEDVCSGNTGHIEVIKILFNPAIISYNEILEIFFATHDPTSQDHQGNDIGHQYRSVIFYLSEKQKNIAKTVISRLDTDRTFSKPIVTEVLPLNAFYESEPFHQNYYEKNISQPYCQFVISPKLSHFRRKFPAKLKVDIPDYLKFTSQKII
jgi:peptide-methionine (S)-S-oxide reductase